MGLNLFKLEKLKIKAYGKATRNEPPSKTFEAMFNPSSFKRSYKTNWHYKEQQPINNSAPELVYTSSDPGRLVIDLLLDGTGVDQMGVMTLLGSNTTVSKRITKFLDVAYDYDGKAHEPNCLVVEWGSLNFPCRLESVDINYTNFDRDGTPLRAELAASFISDEEAERTLAKEDKKSPDLTHVRIAREGDTLPLLASAVYGSSAYYLDVARFNKLDNFRSLTAGQQIVFPPLVSLVSGS